MKKFYKGKKILITGGTGLIGMQLISILLSYESKVYVVSLDAPIDLDKRVKFFKKDLRNFKNCLDVCKNIDYVFHLAGIKGSPKMTLQKPASFMTPTLLFSMNMLEAAKRQNVKMYMMYTGCCLGITIVFTIPLTCDCHHVVMRLPCDCYGW